MSPVVSLLVLIALSMVAVISVSVITSILSPSKHMQSKSNLHVARKIHHFFSGVVIIVIYHSFFDANMAAGVLFLSCAGVILAHIARSLSPRFRAAFVKLFGAIMRPREVVELPSAFFFLLSCGISIACFRKDVSMLTMLYLSLGDPVASFFGVLIDSGRFVLPGAGGKSLAGCLAASSFCALTTLGYHAVLCGSAASVAALLPTALLGGVIGGLAELITISTLDDNLTIPLLSGAMLLAVEYVTAAVWWTPACVL